jgi:hypothetical protein
VGPLEPRVYWIRRAVLSGAVLVVIIVIAVSCTGGGGSTKKPPAHKTTPRPTNSSPAAQVAACGPTALTLTLSTDSQTYTSGQAAKLMGVFANTSSTACTLAVAPATEIWTVKSGSATVWTTQGCTSSKPGKTITIEPGATKTRSIFWPGHLLASGCGSGAVAAAGTYTVSATLDGVKAKKAAVFHIT